jgi:hypothetical protein
VSLIIQQAKALCCVTLLSVAYQALPYFSKLPHKRHEFWGEKYEQKISFGFLFNFLPETFLILRKMQ